MSNRLVFARLLETITDMENFFKEVTPENIDDELKSYGNSLRQRLDIPIAEYDGQQSRFYRYVMPAHINRGVQDREH